MPADELPNSLGNLINIGASSGIKIFVMLFVVFYLVFALILFRQIQLMDRAIPTPIAPFLKFLGILQVGIALAFLFIVIGLF